MANAAKLALETPVRAMLVGYPGAGKTGALAPLVDAGFKLRVLDFDGNMEPVFSFVKDPAKLANVDIIALEDKLRNGQKFLEASDIMINSAFKRGLDMMDEWKYKEADGIEVNLGRSRDWSQDTIVVLDSLTSMGQSAFRRVQALLNKTPVNTTQAVWGIAQSEQENFIDRLTSKVNRFHVIVMAHLVMIGPKDIEKDDSDLTKDLKERTAQLVPTRLFPSALGMKLPPKIGGHFSTLLRVEPKYSAGGQVKRIIRTLPQPELDVKLPAPNIPAELPIEDGMLTIFRALSPASVALVLGNTALTEGTTT
jgi:AAA domain